MSIRTENNRVRTESYETVKTTVVTMPKADYTTYTWSLRIQRLVQTICWISVCCGLLITVFGMGFGQYAANTLKWSTEAIVWTWVLSSFGFSFGPVPILVWIEKRQTTKRYELLEKNGLKYDSWQRHWPRHRVELDKSAN